MTSNTLIPKLYSCRPLDSESMYCMNKKRKTKKGIDYVVFPLTWSHCGYLPGIFYRKNMQKTFHHFNSPVHTHNSSSAFSVFFLYGLNVNYCTVFRYK